MTTGTIDVFPLPRGAASGTGTVGGWYISSYFGGRPNPFTGVPSWHGGMDLPVPKLTPFYAVKAGRVLQSWDSGGGGNWTRLECDDGDVFGYGHADHFAPGVNGRHVQAGEVVAYADSTGSSTGHHLHFAYAPKGNGGRYGDPFDLLTGCRSFVGDPAPIPATMPTYPKPALGVPQPTPEETDMGVPAYKLPTEPTIWTTEIRDGHLWYVPVAGPADATDMLVSGAVSSIRKLATDPKDGGNPEWDAPFTRAEQAGRVIRA